MISSKMSGGGLHLVHILMFRVWHLSVWFLSISRTHGLTFILNCILYLLCSLSSFLVLSQVHLVMLSVFVHNLDFYLS